MSWAEVKLSLPREQAALAESLLEQQGALAVTLEDQADVPVLEPALGTAPLWPVVSVRGLFAAGVDRSGVSAALLLLPGVVRPQALEWSTVDDRDWERAWMDRFEPMQFGHRLWIVPTGMEGPADADAIILHLDPGLAFGTGTHPTTRLCLEWVDSQDFTGLDVVDFGCGSGVLGIAAALKGARRVICVDNDPQALEATAENASRNGVTLQLLCQTPEDYRTEPAHVVLANILAGPLVELAPVLSESLCSGGQLVLSGVLTEQAAGVAQAYRSSCGELQVAELEEWSRLHGRRH